MDARDIGLEFESRFRPRCAERLILHRRCGGSRDCGGPRHEPFNVVFTAPEAGILPMALLQLAHNPKSIGGISDVGVISEAGG